MKEKILSKGRGKPHTWITVLTRECPLEFPVTVVKGYSLRYMKEMLGFDFGIDNYQYVKGEIRIDLNDLKILQHFIKGKMEKNPAYLEIYIETCNKQGEKLLNIARQIHAVKNLKAFTNIQLLEWYKRYYEELLKYMPFLLSYNILVIIFEEIISTDLKKLLSQIGKEGLVDSYLRDLTIPARENWVIKALANLLEISSYVQSNPRLRKLFFESSPDLIAEKIPEADKKLFSDLQTHIQTFGFLDIHFHMGLPTSLEKAISEVKDLIRENCKEKLEGIRKRRKEAEQKFEAIIKELEITNDLFKLIKLAREHNYFRLHRMDVVAQAAYYAMPLIEETAKRIGVKYEDFLNFTPDEVLAFLEKGIKPPLERLREIKETGYAYIITNGKGRVFTGKELAPFIEKKKIEDVHQLEGTVASKGKYIGHAKIATSVHEIEKVKDGDVLVTIMTEPSYLPALIRAGAVVTDEGGILSHAQIVSRELGLPCVIDTKIATKAFRNGDLLEVNAMETKGIVSMKKKADEGE